MALQYKCKVKTFFFPSSTKICASQLPHSWGVKLGKITDSVTQSLYLHYKYFVIEIRNADSERVHSHL